jgi:hypothetical protein
VRNYYWTNCTRLTCESYSLGVRKWVSDWGRDGRKKERKGVSGRESDSGREKAEVRSILCFRWGSVLCQIMCLCLWLQHSGTREENRTDTNIQTQIHTHVSMHTFTRTRIRTQTQRHTHTHSLKVIDTRPVYPRKKMAPKNMAGVLHSPNKLCYFLSFLRFV